MTIYDYFIQDKEDLEGKVAALVLVYGVNLAKWGIPEYYIKSHMLDIYETFFETTMIIRANGSIFIDFKQETDRMCKLYKQEISIPL